MVLEVLRTNSWTKWYMFSFHNSICDFVHISIWVFLFWFFSRKFIMSISWLTVWCYCELVVVLIAPSNCQSHSHTHTDLKWPKFLPFLFLVKPG
jgi:hypothetical protein